MRTSNRSKFHKGGYAALLTTISLALTIMAFAISAFRETRQSSEVQVRNQLKLDYSQKEDALLRSLLHIVPNYAMQAMMQNSENNRNNLDWPSIFSQALTQAQTDLSLDPGEYSTLGISVNVVSSNTGDAVYNPQNFITSPNGDGRLVMRDNSTVRIDLDGNVLGLPPRMRYYDGGGRRSGTHPILNFDKTMLGEARGSLYTEMPYPEIAFGYADQGTDFLAKRNWWAFTINFGSASAAVTGIAPTPRTYVLSIYEVPSQLAISSSGATTALGEFSGGTSWDPANITIAGSVYAKKALISDTNNIGRVSSREGLELDSGAPSGQTVGGLAERRNLQATTNTFHRFSSSSESGLVSFTPINRGVEFFDYFAGTSATERTTNFYSENTTNNTTERHYFSGQYNQNTINARSWDNYSIGAQQTKIQVEIGRTEGGTQLPDRVYVSARFGNDSRTERQRCSRATTDGEHQLLESPRDLRDLRWWPKLAWLASG